MKNAVQNDCILYIICANFYIITKNFFRFAEREHFRPKVNLLVLCKLTLRRGRRQHERGRRHGDRGRGKNGIKVPKYHGTIFSRDAWRYILCSRYY
jgi:hypothetical protein